jgi:hypothetical protein
MAVIVGLFPQSTLSGAARIYISSDLDGYGDDWIGCLEEWEAQSAPGAAPVATHWPVSAAPAPRVGVAQKAYFDDYYNRVHVVPQRLDLGNVVSTQTSPVYVWNAWLAPRTLTAISGLAEGVEVAGQPAPPMLYPPLVEREYQISVTPDGAPVLDTSVAWQFDNGDAPALRITASRIIAWSFVPDWGDGVTERLSWATDILQSESLAEQRRSLRIAPRREFEAPMVVDGRERQYLDMVLFGWGARVWALPVWPEIQRLQSAVPAGSMFIPCATSGLEFHVGGLAMLRGESAFSTEVVEVEAVSPSGITIKRATQSAWLAGTRLYPARSAQLLAEPEISRLTDTAVEVGVAFRVLDPSDVASSAPPTLYRGRPVLDARPDESEALTSQYARLLAELDAGTAAPLVTDVAGRALPVMSQRWVGMGRTERLAFRSMLYHLAGRFAPVWVPTHADDLTLLEPVGAASTTMDVAWVGYTRFGKNRAGRRDIRIERAGGPAVHLRITGSTELSTTAERLALEVAPGVEITPSDVLRINWISLCRLDSDTVEILHHTDSEGAAEAALVFRGVRDDDV